jgi:hypothetical protein
MSKSNVYELHRWIQLSEGADGYTARMEASKLTELLEAALAEARVEGMLQGAQATQEQAHSLGEGAGFSRGREYGLKEGLGLISQNAKCRADHELAERLKQGFTYGGPIMDLSRGSK